MDENAKQKTLGAFGNLIDVITKLRDPEKGCPWDKEQNFETLKTFLIEEAYEILDAVDKSTDELREELGDIQAGLALYAEIAFQNKVFEPYMIFQGITDKLIRRHPHIFADASVSTSDEVRRNWEKIKKAERKETKGLLDSIPKSLPALMKAQQVGERCARVGFEWREVREVKEKVLEEISEFLNAQTESAERQAEEFGDILFSLSQLSRRLGFNSEQLLNSATQKFAKRFRAIERMACEKFGEKGLEGLSLEEMDALWNQVKLDEAK